MEPTQPNEPQKNNSMMIIMGIVILLLIGGGIWFVMSQSNNAAQDNTAIEQQPATEEAMIPQESTTDVSPAVDAAATGEVKEFTVSGKNFSFAPTQLRVKEGDTVRIVFENTGGFHDLVIDDFNVETAQIQDGQSETVEFVASKKGTFEYYCSVGRHREMGMKGTLVVE